MRRRALLAGSLAALARPALARPPPLRLVVAAAAGGSQDAFARLTAEGLGRRLGVRVLVENLPGAGGLIGFDALSRRPPDGLHWGVGGDQQALLPAWTPPGMTPPALRAAAVGVETPLLLLVRPDGPADLAAFLALDRRRPLAVGTGGLASLAHLAQDLLRAAVRGAWQAIAYRGGAPAARDLLSGALDAAVVAGGVAAPLLGQGQVRGLLALRRTPDPLFPGIPGLDAAGLPPALATAGWHGLVAPAGTPDARLETAAQALSEAVWEVAVPLAEAGLRPAPAGPAAAAARIAAEAARFGDGARALARRERAG